MGKGEKFAQDVWEKVSKQFTSGKAGEAHDLVKQRHNKLDEINRQLEEGDDPNSDIFEKQDFKGKYWD